MIGLPFFTALGTLIVKYTELNAKLNPDEVNQFITFCGGFFCFLVAVILHYKGNKWLERDLLKEGFVEVEDVGSVPQNLLFDKKRFYIVAIIYVMYRISWVLFYFFLPIISK